MSKAFIPRKAFEQHWHQIMGGNLEKNPKLMHLGIFIRGAVPASRSIDKSFSLTALNFQRFGSLNLMIAQFPRILLPYDFLDELSHIWADGSVRPDAFIFLRKDKDGNIMGMEGSRLHEEEDIASINVLLAAIVARAVGSPELAGSKAQVAADAAAIGDFGLSAEDIQGIARKLPENHSAIVILFENVWERS